MKVHVALMLLVVVAYSSVSYCQPPMMPPDNNNDGCTNGVCPATAPYHEPTITTDDTNRYVDATGCPPYDNPNWNNPGDACVIEETYTLPLQPKFAPTPIPVGEELESFNGIIYLKEDPAPIFGAIGVLINGVVVFGRGSPCGFGSDCPSDGTGAPSEYVDAVDSEGHTIDQCGGHPQMQGEYHIHSGATFMNSTGRQMCDLPVDTEGEHSVLLGWMFDGFPMYGQYSQGGELPTTLDECHGHTHEIDGVMTYHYHMPLSYPHIIGCFKGCPETSNVGQDLSNRASQYGCSDGGLDTDPDPVYEVSGATSSTEQTSTQTSSITSTAASSSFGTTSSKAITYSSSTATQIGQTMPTPSTTGALSSTPIDATPSVSATPSSGDAAAVSMIALAIAVFITSLLLY